jgi:hypothetical protein
MHGSRLESALEALGYFLPPHVKVTAEGNPGDLSLTIHCEGMEPYCCYDGPEQGALDRVEGMGALLMCMKVKLVEPKGGQQ